MYGFNSASETAYNTSVWMECRDLSMLQQCDSHLFPKYPGAQNSTSRFQLVVIGGDLSGPTTSSRNEGSIITEMVDRSVVGASALISTCKGLI